MKYLIDNNLIKDKVIADIGAGSFALGIIAVKHGATMAMGVDITTDAVATAQKNIENNKLTDKARILEGNGVTPLLNEFTNKVDILVAGAPWDTMTHELFESIPTERRAISYAFYDIDNQLMSSFLKDGPTLLTEGGKMFITACKRIIPRIKDLCSTHRKKYMIVAEDDPHKDGNPHYILEITGE